MGGSGFLAPFLRSITIVVLLCSGLLASLEVSIMFELFVNFSSFELRARGFFHGTSFGCSLFYAERVLSYH